MKQGIFRLEENRVRRNYLGGAGTDRLKGKPVCRDTNRPEEWLGSLVTAKNPGMEPVENEGLSRVDAGGKQRLLRDVILEAPDFYMGEALYGRNGADFGFLFKILDSAMRLHVQAHPTARFAQTYLGSKYGKLECYYIVDVREGVEPYIRLGFQRPVSREDWRDIILRQDIHAMDALFDRVPVRKGEIWLVPGGMPHAIGEGILMLEMMEPSDLVVRCEFERGGVVVPENARFMDRDLDFCLDIFDYGCYSVADITRKQKLEPVLIRDDGSCRLERMVGPAQTDCFEGVRAVLRGTGALTHDGKPAVGVVCAGEAALRCGDDTLRLNPGDAFFVAAGAGSLTYEAREGAEICMMLPG